MVEIQKNLQLGVVEKKFAHLVWEHAPLTSTQLVKLCEEELGWKKSTTYTVLKKFCERGLFRNVSGCVHVICSKEEFESRQSEQFVKETFNGSLPKFIAAFTQRASLSQEEIEEIQKMINDARKD